MLVNQKNLRILTNSGIDPRIIWVVFSIQEPIQSPVILDQRAQSSVLPPKKKEKLVGKSWWKNGSWLFTLAPGYSPFKWGFIRIATLGPAWNQVPQCILQDLRRVTSSYFFEFDGHLLEQKQVVLMQGPMQLSRHVTAALFSVSTGMFFCIYSFKKASSTLHHLTLTSNQMCATVEAMKSAFPASLKLSAPRKMADWSSWSLKDFGV